MLTQVEGIVKSAVGFDPSRGDTVTVENVPFFAPDEGLQAELAKAHKTDQYLKYGGMMAPIVALLLFFLFVLRPLVKFLTTAPQQEYDLSKLVPKELLEAEQAAREAQAISSGGSAGSEQKQIEAGGGESDSQQPGRKPGITGIEPSIDLEQYDEIVAENQRLVKDNPQQAALLIRYWLNDGRLQ
jgi:flagellar M-ring protein FliF